MRLARTLLLLLLIAVPVAADELPADMRASIDKSAAEILAKTGAPSASIAVVRDGQIVYTNAYGKAVLDPATPAKPDMRYSIGSISKQFTAAAVLLLQEDGKLSLDDKVVRWLPELTRAKDITIRELLSMTSGYQDFWPQDYVMPMMKEPVTPIAIANGWARKPLDFEPGTKWQYSNTNYAIAGMIVERVSGMPLTDFLKQRIFTPLHMTSIFDTDQAPLPAGEPMRYLRYALGPLRPAPKEGRGWMFGAGELAMTAHDLALWDISMMDQTVLKPESYREMERDTLLRSGVSSRYGLGVSVFSVNGRRQITHGGEVSGFTARNDVYPDDRAAVVVQTNLDATGASEQIASKIASLLFAKADPTVDAATKRARAIFEGLQHGKIDRALFTPNANSYFTEQALQDFASSLGPLGKPEEFRNVANSLRGGMTMHSWIVKFPKKSVRVWTYTMPDGKLEQYMVAAMD